MTGLPLLDYRPPRRPPSPESLAASEGVDRAGQQRAIVAYLAAATGPATDDEIRRATGIHPNAIRFRLDELRKAKVARVVDKEGVSEAGKRCRRWGRG